MTAWFVFFAPGREPKATVEATVQATSAALREAIARPGLQAAFATVGMTSVSSSPAALSARITAEQSAWRKPVLRANDIRVD